MTVTRVSELSIYGCKLDVLFAPNVDNLKVLQRFFSGRPIALSRIRSCKPASLVFRTAGMATARSFTDWAVELVVSPSTVT